MIHHAFQAELYGLTPAQRTSGAAAVNSALDSEQVQDVTSRTVDANRTIRGQTMLFVECDFTARAAGDRIFAVARNWASTRAADAANGAHSYVRLRSVDDVARTIVMQLAESPGWVEIETEESLDSLV